MLSYTKVYSVDPAADHGQGTSATGSREPGCGRGGDFGHAERLALGEPGSHLLRGGGGEVSTASGLSCGVLGGIGGPGGLMYVMWEQYQQSDTPDSAAAMEVRQSDEGMDCDDVLIQLLVKLEKIENYIKTQRMGGAPSVLPKRTRKCLDGFRLGVGKIPQVGFNPGAKRALPKCPRCPTAGAGHRYQAWADYPLGGKRQSAGSTAGHGIAVL